MTRGSGFLAPRTSGLLERLLKQESKTGRGGGGGAMGWRKGQEGKGKCGVCHLPPGAAVRARLAAVTPPTPFSLSASKKFSGSAVTPFLDPSRTY